MKIQWEVHKFGGTSVANSQRFRNVAKILNIQRGQKVAVVVSAMSKVTDSLIELHELAAHRKNDYLKKLEALKEKHQVACRELFGEDQDFLLEKEFKSLQDFLSKIFKSKKSNKASLDFVSGMGEVFSAQILTHFLQQSEIKAQFIDARKILEIDPEQVPLKIHWPKSKATLKKSIKSDVLVITGFVAKTPRGVPTILGRNGSDYSASIFGNLLDARKITIWTDVDGVLSADPRLVPDAILLKELSYKEAAELAYFGAKVVHPDTMAPAISNKIPIWIRNSLNPSVPGTLISQSTDSNLPIKGVTFIENMALLNLEGPGMIGVPGVANRLFGALKEADVSVVMISQASSEQSICFAISKINLEKAEKSVLAEFKNEIKDGQIEKLRVDPSCSIVAVVGDGMSHQPGVAARFFEAMAKAGTNIRAIAQGSSERNISIVVDSKNSVRALKAAHSAFYLSDQTISLGILGVGKVGSELIKQIQKAREALKLSRGIDLRIRAIANSKQMLLFDKHFSEQIWSPDLLSSSIPFDKKAFVQHIHSESIPHSAIIDCTSSEEITKQYLEWLDQKIHVIAANKKANSGDLDYFLKLNQATKSKQSYFLFETNVGAGLPVISTLKDLIETGDEIISVEGIMSGTLSLIFGLLSPQTPFSVALKKAIDLGFTEPDPRDDLSGLDIARKVVILARICGLSTSLQDIQIESVIPNSLKSKSTADFLASLEDFDTIWTRKVEAAFAKNNILRIVGRVSKSEAPSVQVAEFSSNHPFSQVKSGENVFAFTTKRYNRFPLIVRGPGAGPEVTAAGLFSDLLRLASYLGAKQ